MPADLSLRFFCFFFADEVSRTTFQQHMWLFDFFLASRGQELSATNSGKALEKALQKLSKAFLRANSHSLYGESSGSLKKTALEPRVFLGCSSNCDRKMVSPSQVVEAPYKCAHVYPKKLDFKKHVHIWTGGQVDFFTWACGLVLPTKLMALEVCWGLELNIFMTAWIVCKFGTVVQNPQSWKKTI